MNFEPQKFFIGLMDFFSILLPGALLTYLLMGGVGPIVRESVMPSSPGLARKLGHPRPATLVCATHGVRGMGRA